LVGKSEENKLQSGRYFTSLVVVSWNSDGIMQTFFQMFVSSAHIVVSSLKLAALGLHKKAILLSGLEGL
jgi:hypothetical protein